MKTGIELISQERQRQIEQEGWTEFGDDAQDGRELASGAASYLTHYVARAWTINNEYGLNVEPDSYTKEPPPYDYWPGGWDEKWWKPKGAIPDLVRAGALIAAEIDRLNRLEGSK